MPSVDFRFFLYLKFCVDGPFEETKENVLSSYSLSQKSLKKECEENNENQQLNLVRKI